MERFGDARPRLVNMYGITETTVHVTYRPLSRADLERPGVSPIGTPIPDLEVHLLDDALRPVPAGEVGEIVVAGPGLSRGYLSRPALTAERFPVWNGRRVYRSGDLGRQHADGELEYLGRRDDQVKVRGFRVEPGEVESVVRRDPAVRDAAVLGVEAPAGGTRLVAWIVPEDGAPAGDEALRAHAARFLPEYMLPSAFVRVDAIPLTANGKVDRSALPAPSDARPPLAVAYEETASEWERRLADVWTKVLGVSRVGRRDNFFDVGGTSLLAAEAAEELRRLFGRTLPDTAVFEHPTIESLARLLDRGESAAPPRVSERARRQREAAAAARPWGARG
jgi:non-ribosomal peptide synthetase component F